jgi:hypothetical protein
MSELTLAVIQAERQRALDAVLERHPEESPGEYREHLNVDESLPRYALVSFYEGRKWDGSLICLSAAEGLDGLLASTACSSLDSGWTPTLLVDLDEGTSRAVDCVVTAVLGVPGERF